VKAQIHAGGRGKGGGVKVAKGGAAEARGLAEKILGMQLVTKQTGPEGQKVRRLYIEQGLDIARELYLALLVDRERRRVASSPRPRAAWTSRQVAHDTPEKILTLHVDPLSASPLPSRASWLLPRPGPSKGPLKQFVKLLDVALQVLRRGGLLAPRDQPARRHQGRQIVALDGKVTFDDNAESATPSGTQLRDPTRKIRSSSRPRRPGLSYVSLDGDIGCLVNGAGLAMATMDIIQHYGGSPANFLDVGGGASQEQVKTAFQMILESHVKGIFVNIFGGIMRCDIVAGGVVAATKELGLKVPLVVRLEGTNVELGKKILDESGLAIQAASSMADGAQKIVAAVKRPAQAQAS
jgi:succinyl-CoA synthetase beta subunit